MLHTTIGSRMYYEVTDIEMPLGDHHITARVMIAEDDSTKDIAYMCCSTCSLMSEYHFYSSDPDIFHMEIIEMECYLHAEGFDVEWSYGELDKLDS